jgi:hypothetical protein
VAVDANDIGRTKRQQDLLMAMLSQIDRPSSIGEAADLVEAFGAFALTDDSLGENDIIQLAWEMRSLGADDLEAETLPVVDLEENGVWYVTELEPEAAQVIGAFAAGEAMAPARAGPVPVAVQNGNGRIGAAALAGETLDAAGFDVISVGDSGRADYPTTLVISRPDDLPLADAVAEALGFGEAMVGRVPPEADVVVIVGLDVPAG